MDEWSTDRRDGRSAALLITGVVAAGAVLSLGIWFAARLSGYDPGVFVRDPNVLAQQPWYFGTGSMLTVVLWAVAAALSGFVALTGPRVRRPLLWVAALAALLCLDDTLMIHEGSGPVPGVHELVFFAVYGPLGLVTLVVVWRAGVPGALPVLVATGGILALSLVADLVLVDLRDPVQQPGAVRAGTSANARR